MNKLKILLRRLLPNDVFFRFWYLPRGFFTALRYGFPAKKLKVIGVAGTKGKTTTCHLVAHILESAGRKTAMISTAALRDGSQETLNKMRMTTPPSVFLQKFIKEAVRNGCQYLVLETSSHALVQYRTFGISFEVVILTNLSPDHLEYHPTVEHYQLSHQKMINAKTKFLILNGDDSHAEHFLKMPLSNAKRLIYGLNQPADCLAQDVALSATGSRFVVKVGESSAKIDLPLLGKFNVYNALAAISAVLTQGVSMKTVQSALEKFKGTPGRMEEINCGQDFRVIVEFAHSVDSLNNFFEALLALKSGREKVIAVSGSCGERDPKPRPQIGQILDKNTDYIIITNEDPYGEDPEKIAQDLLAGIKTKKFGENLWKILDRREAIYKAVSLAQKGDLVLILGKGAEQLQVFKDRKISWDDRVVATEALRQKLQNLS